MRYWLQFSQPEMTEKIWCDSLSEVFLQLKENPINLCEVGSEDGKEHYEGIEADVKGIIAWKILNIEPNAPIPAIRKYSGGTN
jgi:hypothetical protein